MAGFLQTLFGPGQRLIAAAQAQMSKAPGPETPSADAVAMAAKWQLIADVMEGKDTIKRGATRYLPRFQNESNTNYERRLCDAPWRPIFPAAIESLTSRPFTKPVTLQGTISKKMQRFGGDDVDSCGNSISIFSRRVFDDAVTYGVTAIFVDYTRAIKHSDGRPLSIADEIEQGLRPYWVQIRGRDLIDVKTDFRNGREVVTHVRWHECQSVADGFGERYVQRIRIVELDAAGKPHWSLYERQTNGGYEKIASGDLGILEIPLALLFTGRRQGAFAVKPPLYDLAIVALEHYRAMARSTEIENFSGWPTLVAKGLAKEPNAEPMTVGPGVVLYAPGENTDWHIIGPDAALVAEVAKSPERVMDEFRRLAMEPTIPVGNVTATASAIDNSRAHSAIEAWGGSLKDMLDQTLRFTAMWLGENDLTTANVSTDFIAMAGNVEEARVLGNAQQRGVISAKTERAELKRRSMLAPDWEEDQEEQRIAEETLGLESEVQIDPRTGQPINAAVATRQ